MRRSFLVTTALIAALISPLAPQASAAPKAEVTVSGGWVKASDTTIVGGMTGAFAKITNRTKKTITLVSGTSSFTGTKELEVHHVVNGVMSKKAGGISIAPGNTAILEPGGLHVMFVGLTKPIKPGDMVDLALKFKGIAKPVALKWTARAAAAGAETYAPTPMPGMSTPATTTK